MHGVANARPESPTRSRPTHRILQQRSCDEARAVDEYPPHHRRETSELCQHQAGEAARKHQAGERTQALPHLQRRRPCGDAMAMRGRTYNGGLGLECVCNGKHTINVDDYGYVRVVSRSGRNLWLRGLLSHYLTVADVRPLPRGGLLSSSYFCYCCCYCCSYCCNTSSCCYCCCCVSSSFRIGRAMSLGIRRNLNNWLRNSHPPANKTELNGQLASTFVGRVQVQESHRHKRNPLAASTGLHTI
jgi:hypothetical protein